MKKNRKTNRCTNRIMSLLLAVVLIFACIRPITVNATEANTPVEKVDFKDFSNWRSGIYNYTTGRYGSYSTRICLKDYVIVDNDQYVVSVNDSNYHLLIRELDKNKNFIKSYNLTNSAIYVPSANAYYLGIGIYKATGESGITYNTYSQLFSNGFYAGLKAIQKEETDSTTPSDNTKGTNDKTESNTSDNSSSVIENTVYDVTKIDYKNFLNWRSGNYNYTTGRYGANKSRLCLNDYVTVSGGEYKVCVKDSAYHLLIRELDTNKTFIKSYNLANGQSYTPSANAAYLGISIYKLSGESSISYDTFKTLFANGFYAGLEVVEEEETEEEDIILDNGADNSTDSTNNESGVYTVLKQALLTTDSSEKDISKYNISTSDFYAEWNKIKQDCYLEYHTYGNVYPLPTVQSGVVKKFQFCNMDSGYAKRLEKVKKAVNDFCDSVDNKMTDMDKVLLAHEYVVSNTQYLRYDQSATMAGGPLGNGYGICGGYADAMMVLLHYVGVETDEITSGKMGHGWLYVKVDGQWYHVDPTWDDTLKGSNEIYAHRFFIRNDSEFLDIGGKKHYSWFFTNGSKTSTSTKYVNWFVHDVAGTMYYYNGLWYYKDNSTNSIVCSDINGNARKIVVNGQQESTIKLSGISGNVLTYTVGAEKRTISL